MEAVIKPD